MADLDGDGSATVRDAAVLTQFLKNGGALSETQRCLADIDRDGGLSDADVKLILDEVVGRREQQALPASSIRNTTPGNGDSDIGTKTKVIVDFEVPLAAGTVIPASAFQAEFGGESLPASIVLSDNRRRADLVFAGELPANARVRVSIDGTGINDIFGRPTDFDQDGVAGGIYSFSFDTVSIDPVIGTGVTGQIFASELEAGGPGGGADVPLAGVTISVDGSNGTMTAVTDANGQFTLSPCPAGSFFVHIDGRTSPLSDFPNGDFYPVVGKVWEASGGRIDNPAGGSGVIYLPCICTGTLQAVSQATETSISFAPDVLSDYPEFAGAAITVPAGSLRNDDGSPGGKVGIAPVPRDRLPGTLPPGLDLPLVITVQTDGAPNFDTPAPICLPNVPDPVSGEKLPAGSKSALWSFDHAIGAWIVVGPMTVSDDGNFIKTDPGVGIRAPGWHGSRPGSQGRGNTQGIDCGDLSAARLKQMTDVLSNGVNAGADLTFSATDFVAGLGGLARAGTSRIASFFQVFGVMKGVKDCVNQRTFSACAGAAVDTASLGLAVTGTAVSTPVAVSLFLAGTALDYVNTKDSVDALKSSMNPIEVNMRDCIGGQKRFTPAQRTQRRQAVSQDAARANQAADLARVELQQQEPLYQDLKDEFDDLEPSAQLVKDNVTPANPGGGLTLPQWDDFGTRVGRIGDKMRNLHNRPGLDRILQDLINKNRDFHGTCGTGLFPPRRFPSPPTPGGGVLIDIIPPNYPPPPAPPGPSFCILERPGFENRFESDGTGAFSVILSPGLTYTFKCYEPGNNRYGIVAITAPANGRLANFPRVPLWPDTNPDTDGDGLSDKAEHVIGTNANLFDTDTDGVNDGAEVRNGTNPLDDIPVSTGVISRAPVTGSAEDICAVNNLAITANGTSGISVFNVFSGINPVRVIEFDTPGSAVAVACSANHVAIADYSSGLAILDIDDPDDPQLVRRINLGGNVVAVTTDGPVAYAGTQDGNVFCIDMLTGAKLNGIHIPHGKIMDLFISKETLYILQTGHLSTVQLGTTTFGPATTVSAPGGTGAGQRRLRLFAGGGVLYSTWRQGYNIFDIDTDPNTPVHLQQVTTTQQGWKQIIANGSGLGIAAVSPNSTNDGPHHIDIYDLGSNGQGSTYLDTIETPGLAAAVAINCGIAYVADSTGGLTVINYRATDTAGNAPAISLSSNFPLASGQVEESSLMRLTASVTDDIQACAVEFYVDDELVLTDGNFPFEHRFRAPSINDASEIKVRARALDTGGNSTWSTEYILTLTPDAVPPQIVAFVPEDDSYHVAVEEVSVVFSEEMDADTLAAGGLTLTSAGPDRTFGNEDDIPINNGQLSTRAGVNAIFLAYSESLQPGLYRVSVQAPAADLAGNLITSSGSADFIIVSDADLDLDGIADDLEPLLGLDPGDIDTDNNGTNDGDEDFDGDGIPNRFELPLGLNPSLADTNGDGTSDGDEDFDSDYLTNAQEIALGTDPLLVDSDSDGLDDFNENLHGSDPTNFASGTSNAVSTGKITYQNAISGELPITLTDVRVSSPATSYINALFADPPSVLTNIGVSSPATSYFNPLLAPAPTNLEKVSTSATATYDNQNP